MLCQGQTSVWLYINIGRLLCNICRSHKLKQSTYQFLVGFSVRAANSMLITVIYAIKFKLLCVGLLGQQSYYRVLYFLFVCLFIFVCFPEWCHLRYQGIYTSEIFLTWGLSSFSLCAPGIFFLFLSYLIPVSFFLPTHEDDAFIQMLLSCLSRAEFQDI